MAEPEAEEDLEVEVEVAALVDEVSVVFVVVMDLVVVEVALFSMSAGEAITEAAAARVKMVRKPFIIKLSGVV